jgi:hypothetical protein
MILVHGKTYLAQQILNDPKSWRADPAIAQYEDAVEYGRTPTLGQLKALALSLKQHTADGDPEVGGPSQIAVLTNGKIASIDQPSFPPLAPVSFRFQIETTLTLVGSRAGGRPKPGTGVTMYGRFGVLYEDKFVHTWQSLDDSYWANNEFADSTLFYGGGRTLFQKSNQVTNCDLEIGAAVGADSPVAAQLLKDFKWRSVDDRRVLSSRTTK